MHAIKKRKYEWVRISEKMDKNDVSSYNYYPTLATVNSQEITNRLGVGFGMGFRKFSNRGLYWGCILSLGRYLTNMKTTNSSANLLELTGLQNYIFDIEFFKVGYAF